MISNPQCIYILNPQTKQAELIHDEEADWLNVSFRHCRINNVRLK